MHHTRSHGRSSQGRGQKKANPPAADQMMKKTKKKNSNKAKNRVASDEDKVEEEEEEKNVGSRGGSMGKKMRGKPKYVIFYSSISS